VELDDPESPVEIGVSGISEIPRSSSPSGLAPTGSGGDVAAFWARPRGFLTEVAVVIVSASSLSRPRGCMSVIPRAAAAALPVCELPACKLPACELTVDEETEREEVDTDAERCESLDSGIKGSGEGAAEVAALLPVSRSRETVSILSFLPPLRMSLSGSLPRRRRSFERALFFAESSPACRLLSESAWEAPEARE
jgi:hypothetical protein